MDERKLAKALALFDGLRKNVPSFIRETVIDNYHSIVDALAEATGDDLAAFKIPSQEVKPKAIATRRRSFSGRPGSTRYSTDKYCDDSRFQSQIDSLAAYLESAGYRKRKPATDSQTPHARWGG